MSIVPPTAIECPQCHGVTTVPMSNGERLCLDCRLEWNPTTVSEIYGRLEAVPDPTTDVGEPELPPEFVASLPPPPLTVDDVLTPPPEVLAERDAQAELDALIGTEVVLEGGQVARVLGFPDDDHMEVAITHDDGTNRNELVGLEDVTRSLAPAQPVGDVPDEVAAELAKTYVLIAGLAIKAGMATLEGDDTDYRLGTPPSGWVPEDAAALPAIELGVGYAIAMLVKIFGIPRADVDHLADVLIEKPKVQDQPKGVTE